MSGAPGIVDDLRQAFGDMLLAEVDPPAVAPTSSDDVLSILTWCRDRQWQVMPVGQGHAFAEDHHVPAGVLPVLTTKRKGVSAVDTRDLAVDVEPGVPASAVLEHVRQAGMTLDGWPGGYPGTVGGLLCGERGPEVRHLVLGMLVINGRGQMLKFGGAVRKDVSGFDAAGGFIGSRGWMGWLERVTLRLRPLSTAPMERTTLPPSTHNKLGRGLHRQVALAYDPDDVFYKPEG